MNGLLVDLMLDKTTIVPCFDHVYYHVHRRIMFKNSSSICDKKMVKSLTSFMAVRSFTSTLSLYSRRDRRDKQFPLRPSLNSRDYRGPGYSMDRRVSAFSDNIYYLYACLSRDRNSSTSVSVTRRCCSIDDLGLIEIQSQIEEDLVSFRRAFRLKSFTLESL